MANVVTSRLSDGTNTGYFASQAFFECSTAANTAAKTASGSNSIMFSNTSLVNGLTIKVRFKNTNTAQNPTLKVGTSDAIPLVRADVGSDVYTSVGETVVGSWKAGAIVSLTCHVTLIPSDVTIYSKVWVINDHSEAVGSIVVGSTTFYPQEYNSSTQKPTGSVDLTSAIDNRISAAGVLPSVSASDNGKALKVVDGAWAAANFDKPEKIFYAIPLAESSGSYVLSPTSSATRWQFSDEDHVDWQAGTVSKWFTADEIHELWKTHNIVFMEILIDDEYSPAGLVTYYECIEAVTDGIEQPLLSFIESGWDPGGASATFANFEKNKKIVLTFTSPFVSTAAYGSITAIPVATHTHGNITDDGKIGSTASQAVYTTTNGVLTAGTLPTTATNAALSQLPTWSATPTDTTMLLRRDTGGTASYGQVAFSTVNNYIKTKNPVLDHLTYDSTEEAVKFIWS